MGHYSDAAFRRRGDDAGAVWADEAGARLHAQGRVDAEHVVQGDVFGDGDDEGNFGLDGFEDCGGGVGGGDEDGGGGGFVGVKGGEGFADSGVGGKVGEVRVGVRGWDWDWGLEGGGDAAEDLGAVGEGCEGVVGCLGEVGRRFSAGAMSDDGDCEDAESSSKWRGGGVEKEGNVLLCR